MQRRRWSADAIRYHQKGRAMATYAILQPVGMNVVRISQNDQNSERQHRATYWPEMTPALPARSSIILPTVLQR
jgi:hypothetical protein